MAYLCVQAATTRKKEAMFKQILVCAALVTTSMANPASSQQSHPNSSEAKRIEALVDKAAGLVEKLGKAVFPEMRKRGSEWYSGDVYVFAYDSSATVILQPAFPEREGQHMAGQKDKNGKLFHDEFMNVVKTKGSGWVDYWWPKPGQTQPSQKWSYVKAVKIDGALGLVGAGFYPE
jgi:cytochrome c